MSDEELWAFKRFLLLEDFDRDPNFAFRTYLEELSDEDRCLAHDLLSLVHLAIKKGTSVPRLVKVNERSQEFNQVRLELHQQFGSPDPVQGFSREH
jgi:hypothetical protein